MIKKVKVTRLPKIRKEGLGVNGNMIYPIYKPNMMAEPELAAQSTLQPVDREDANLEAEKGETAYVPDAQGLAAHYKIGGKRHSEGGTPLNLPDDSFIFSDTNKMKIGGPAVQDFGKNPNKKYTPADIAKQYDINQYRAILADPSVTDPIQRNTAEMMIANYNLKLGKLGLIQEAKKGFPQGIPAMSLPYLMHAAIDPAQMLPIKGKPGTQEAESQDMSPESQNQPQGRYGFIMANGGSRPQPWANFGNALMQDGGYNSQEEYEDHLLDPYSAAKRQAQAEWYAKQSQMQRELKPSHQVHPYQPQQEPQQPVEHPDLKNSLIGAYSMLSDPSMLFNTTNKNPEEVKKRFDPNAPYSGYWDRVTHTNLFQRPWDNSTQDPRMLEDEDKLTHPWKAKGIMDYLGAGLTMGQNELNNLLTGLYEPFSQTVKRYNPQLSGAAATALNFVDPLFVSDLAGGLGNMAWKGLGKDATTAAIQDVTSGLAKQEAERKAVEETLDKAVKSGAMTEAEAAKRLESFKASTPSKTSLVAPVGERQPGSLIFPSLKGLGPTAVTDKAFGAIPEAVKHGIEYGKIAGQLAGVAGKKFGKYATEKTKAITDVLKQIPLGETKNFIRPTVSEWMRQQAMNRGSDTPTMGTVNSIPDNVVNQQVQDTLNSLYHAPQQEYYNVGPPLIDSSNVRQPVNTTQPKYKSVVDSLNVVGFRDGGSLNRFGSGGKTGVDGKIIYKTKDEKGNDIWMAEDKNKGTKTHVPEKWALDKLKTNPAYDPNYNVQPESNPQPKQVAVKSATPIQNPEADAKPLYRQEYMEALDARQGLPGNDARLPRKDLMQLFVPAMQHDLDTLKLWNNPEAQQDFKQRHAWFFKENPDWAPYDKNGNKIQGAVDKFHDAYNKYGKKMGMKEDYFTGDASSSAHWRKDDMWGLGTFSAPALNASTPANKVSAPVTEEVKKPSYSPQAVQPRDPQFYKQDVINTAAAAGNLASLKKYMPWGRPVAPNVPDPTFHDFTRQAAGVMEAANIGAMGAAAFGDPRQYAASFSQMQGEASKHVADTLSQEQNQNVQAANAFSSLKGDIMQKTDQYNASLASKLYDDTTRANENYDNAKRHAKDVLRSNYVNAITNRANTQVLNSLYPDYQIDPSTGGNLVFNPHRKSFDPSNIPDESDHLTNLWTKLHASDPSISMGQVLNAYGKHPSSYPDPNQAYLNAWGSAGRREPQQAPQYGYTPNQ